jgi:hypothetical protein
MERFSLYEAPFLLQDAATGAWKFTKDEASASSSSNAPLTPASPLIINPRSRSRTKQSPFSKPSASFIGTSLDKDTHAPASTAVVIDAPFDKAVGHLKKYKDEEKTPTKAPRNASLPEEIAQLVEQAGEEDHDIEQHRDLDLAPSEPVMQHAVAGDIIMPATPASSSRDSLFSQNNTYSAIPVEELSPRISRTPASFHSSDCGMGSLNGGHHEVEVPGHFHDTFPVIIHVEPNSDAVQVAEWVRPRAEELDARIEAINDVVEVCETEDDVKTYAEVVNPFKTKPERYKVDNDMREAMEENGQCEVPHPIFVNVIGLLPAAMAAAIVHPVAPYADAAIEMVLNKIAGLTIWEGEKEV